MGEGLCSECLEKGCNIKGFPSTLRKIEAYFHAEADVPENKTQEAIDKYIYENCELGPIDNTFPLYVQDHVNELKSKGLIY